jgi:hypothetical protein
VMVPVNHISSRNWQYSPLAFGISLAGTAFIFVEGGAVAINADV